MELEDFFSKFNTEDIMSYIIEMQMYPKMKYQDRIIPMAEALSANLIRYNKNNGNKTFSRNSLYKIGDKLVKAPIIQNFQETIKLKDATDDVKQKHLKTLNMKLKHIYSRGDAYTYQLINFSNMLYSPFDNEFKDKLGFTYTCVEKLFIYIYQKYCNNALGELKHKFNPFYFIKRKFNVSNNYIYRIPKDELYNNFNREEIDNIINVLGIKIGDSTIKKFEINTFNPLYEKPIVDFGSFIYIPIIKSNIMNLPKLFHYTFIAKKIFDKPTIESYKKHRGDIVESLTVEYLKKFFDDDSIHQSLKYPAKKKTYEADVTVQDSNVSIFCECKSKILTLPTLRGDFDSLKKDINQAINIAYEQAVRSIKWLQKGNIFIEELTNKDIEVELAQTKYYFIFCITAENFGFVPFDIYDYITINKDVPIISLVINIYDLEIIANECSTKEELLNYLFFRKVNYKTISSYDELDVLGLFKEKGNVQLHIDADQVLVTSYTDVFDKKYEIKSIQFIRNYDTSYMN